MKEQTNILLEAGTNELEVLVCSVAGTPYGVNVAKVREVIKSVKTTKIPRSHPAMVGTFLLRDSIIPLIELYHYFGIKGDPPPCDQRSIVVMEFNNVVVGFLVDALDRIHRVSWKSITPAPSVAGHDDTPITSICRVEEKVVLMIDFEKIVFDISGKDHFAESAAQIEHSEGRSAANVLLAEDSPTMRRMISESIISSGYTNIVAVEDGQSAWDYLIQQASGDVATPFDLLITDIEMPQLDGLALTKRVKEHPQLGNLPVIVFSSLVSPDNIKKIEAVNADAQITKPELANLVGLIDRLLGIDTHQTAEPDPCAV